MKTSFQQADEIKDARDKEFLEQFDVDLDECVGCGNHICNCSENIDAGECQECGKSWYFCTCSSQE